MKLDSRTTELIALGAAVGANCKACLEFHLGEARKAGVQDDEILDAVEVGKMVRRGAASQVDKVAAKLGPERAAQAGGCCR
ncbi:MAG: carboxymuconolactone decarboxylase family protein [Betaproteobacteria bacterium]|nr:carboxymuconolactone decarboxylase family protein [Betaproteobacteria bacterium]